MEKKEKVINEIKALYVKDQELAIKVAKVLGFKIQDSGFKI